MPTRLPIVAFVLALPALAHAQTVYVRMPVPRVFLPPMPPHIFIRQRVRWHRPPVFVAAPPVYVTPPPVYAAPPPVYVTPPPVYVTPPPVYAAPPPPAYTPEVMPLPPVPPPIVVPPPPVYYYAPPAPPAATVVVAEPAPRPAAPQWKSRFGLGARADGQVIRDGGSSWGVGGELLYRISPHVSTELGAAFQKSAEGTLDRMDIPVTLGLRLHIGRPDWVVSPYFVFAGGVDFAKQDVPAHPDDSAFYLDGQVGGGLELRLGQHVALTFDARLDAKWRANDTSKELASLKTVNNKTFHPLDDEIGGQFRLGFAVYF